MRMLGEALKAPLETCLGNIPSHSYQSIIRRGKQHNGSKRDAGDGGLLSAAPGLSGDTIGPREISCLDYSYESLDIE